MAISSTSGVNQAYSKVQQIDNSATQKKPLDEASAAKEKFQLASSDSNKAAQVPAQDNETKILSKDQQKAETQANLIQHLFGDGAPKEQNALRILFQETITKLNDMLAPELGGNAISMDKLAEQGGMEYWSPENTANRIVQGTTGFFEAFKTANPKLEGEELLDKFLSVIGGGIEKGYQDAAGILDGFGVFDGSIKDNAEKTFALVQDGLQAFRAQQMEAMGLTQTKPADAAETSN